MPQECFLRDYVKIIQNSNLPHLPPPPQKKVYEIGYRHADKVEQQGKQKGPTQRRDLVSWKSRHKEFVHIPV